MTNTDHATGPATPPTFGFGDRLRLARRSLGWTQQQFAQILTDHGRRTSKVTVGYWESSGHSEPDGILALAATLEAITGYPQAWWLGVDTPSQRAA
jgi:transcriptional regulator with XRE-family HTH domain